MKWIAIFGLMLVAACAKTDIEPTKPIVIDSKPIERPNLTLPPVDQFRAENVDWIIITPENAAEIFAEMEARGQAAVVFAVDEDGYEAISLNNQQALRVILQQQTVIDGYQQYYIVADRNIANHNANR